VRSKGISGKRPRPSAWVLEDTEESRFEPATDLPEWVSQTFLEAESPLFNLDHAHLQEAVVRFLWAGCPNKTQDKQILGTAQLGRPTGKPWPRGRQEQQLREWFGCVPDFLITLDAQFCHRCSDVSLCALVEHELYHCAHAEDKFGEPRFDRDGNPIWFMRSHDVEEFVGVVERYGDWEAGLQALGRALAHGPLIGRADIAGACGTCLRVA